MGVSNGIKAILSLANKKQSDLMQILGMSSKQSLSNKVTNERWSAKDLVSIAEVTDSKLAFILPDGQTIILSKQERTPDE